MLAYDYIDRDKQGDDCSTCPTCEFNTSTMPAYHDQEPHKCIHDDDNAIYHESAIPGC